MRFRNLLLGVFAGTFASLSLKAQTFETRSTRYSGEKILKEFKTNGHARQFEIRDSVMQSLAGKLQMTDTLETFYNGHHLGLVIHRGGYPFQLLGFWDPDGNPVDGGSLLNGNGVVKTPFNPELIKNFAGESVTYSAGLKNGACFYYCDCASVLRRGIFYNNQKGGLWEEFDADGAFIAQKQLDIPVVPADIGIEVDRWLEPAHCMMQPDIDICPNSNGTKK